MASSRGVAQIPIIAELYEQGALKEALAAAFPASADVNKRVGLIRGDITRLRLDAIVNAANSTLLGGGGVDGVIHRVAGPHLVEECATLGGCPAGEARITKGYKLPAKHVIHTVGPKYFYDDEPENLLRSCYQKSLELAVKEGLQTVAFSAISTGMYGYPSADASRIACETVRKFLDGDDGQKLLRVVFVTFEQKDVDAYNTSIPKCFPPSK